MTPNHNWSFAPFNEDQNQQLFNYHQAAPEAAASSSSQPYPNFTNLTPEVHQSTISSDTAQLALISQEAGRYYHTESESLSLGHEREVNIYTSHGGSCDHRSAPLKNENRNVLRMSVSSKREGKQEKKSKNVSVKWMSSKMRKTMSSDQAATDIPERSTHNDRSSQDSPNGSSNTVRVCADCNTTKTPLWRSGPRGPKSLCNACGIRQRKARRAAMAAAAAAAGVNGTLVAASNTPTKKKEAQCKERKIKLNSHLPFKKRCKFTAQDGSSKKPCFEDSTLVLKNNSSAFQRVFPQDEKEAAILLMALSYGLVHG